MRTDRQADMANQIPAFRNFANAPKNTVSQILIGQRNSIAQPNYNNTKRRSFIGQLQGSKNQEAFLITFLCRDKLSRSVVQGTNQNSPNMTMSPATVTSKINRPGMYCPRRQAKPCTSKLLLEETLLKSQPAQMLLGKIISLVSFFNPQATNVIYIWSTHS